MARIFNSIRQRLLKENRLTRYLVYAVGEILLVVIGILIALQINAWKQAANDERAEVEILQRIHGDLVQDTTSFRKIMAQNLRLREEIRGMLVDLYDGVHGIAEAQALSAVYDQALDQVFAPNDNTYKSVVSAGTIGLIRNQELKAGIVDLYGEYEEIGSLLAAINAWMGGIATAVDTQTDFIKFNEYVLDIYTTAEMVNEQDLSFLNERDGQGFKVLVRAISATAFNQQVRNGYYATLIRKDEQLLRRIEEELRGRDAHSTREP